MKPFRTTIIMGLLAAIFGGVAAYYFPWPESLTTSDQVSEKLFEDFDGETNKVWAFNIVEYDRETEGLKSFGLRRKGQKWVIPGKSNFVATGPLIPMVKSCLSELAFIKEQSDNQQDHEKFGVLDPLDYTKANNRDSLGIKLTLEDVNRTVMASLIIGDQVRGEPLQYYVRKPGQPKVYIVEFDPQILSTKFSYQYELVDSEAKTKRVISWLDPNLFGLRNSLNPDGPIPSEITIQNYRISPEQDRVDRYRATIRPMAPSREESISIEIPKNGDWEPFAISEDNFNTFFMQFGMAAQAISFNIPIDVRPQDKELSNIMTSDPSKITKDAFKEASSLGFSFSKSDGNVDIVGANGGTVIQTTAGVEITVAFGGLAPTREAEANSINYYMIAYAQLLDSMKTEPTKPVPADGAELTDEEKKEFARQVNNWKEQSKNAVTAVEDFNNKHGGWYYIIGENALATFRPEIVVSSPPKVESSEDAKPDDDEASDTE